MRSRVALALGLALATVTACGRGKEQQAPARQGPAARVPMPPGADSARQAGQGAQPPRANPATDTLRKPPIDTTKPPADTTKPPADTTKPPADTTQSPASAPTPGKLYTVQIAAFTNADSARMWTGRLSSQGLPVWTTSVQVHGQTFHRVRIGAVRSVEEARKLGEMLEKRYSWSFWIAPVGPADAVPDGAVQATQRILTG